MFRPLTTAALATTLALSAAALAAPPTITWDEPQTYQIHTAVELALPLALLAERNKEVAIRSFELDLQTTCSPVRRAGKKATVVACNIDHIHIDAEAVFSSASDWLVDVCTETERALVDKVVEIIQLDTGHIRTIDLQSGSPRNARESTIDYFLDLVMERAYSGFDFQVASGTQRKSRAVQPPLPGAMGSIKMVHTFHEDGTLVTQAEGLLSDAEGTIHFDTTMHARSTFDGDTGALLTREFTTSATSTGKTNQFGAAGPYRQTLEMRLVDSDAVAADVSD